MASTLKGLEGKNNEIYRVGGDEFLIITPGMAPAEFLRLEEELKQKCELPNRAHFAVGSCHSDEHDDIRKAMQKADARMYDVKEEYYSRHPEYEWHNKPV